MRFQNWKRRTAMFSVALVASVGIAVTGSSDPAQAAEPQCQNGGVLMVFARGSGSQPGANEATQFFDSVRSALGSIPSQRMELGDQNNDRQLDPNGYPAVHAVWGLVMPPHYWNSVLAGQQELVDLLGRRLQSCPHETIVLGGYSQGAQVVGTLISMLSDAILQRIGYVALYGDPKLHAACGGSPWWLRGNTGWCDGLLEAREPYLPSSLQNRATSWCDNDDGICSAGRFVVGGWGNHGTIYADKWIAQSAPTIAHAAWLKTIELNPQPASPPPPNVNPAPGAGQKLAATKNQDGRLGLFYVGGDSAIYYQYQLNPGGYWGAEKRIPAYAKGIAATTSLDSRIELFYIGGDNAIYHRYQTVANSDSWSAEERFHVGALGISAARNGAGRIELVIIGMNRALYTVKQQAPNSWSNAAMNGSE